MLTIRLALYDSTYTSEVSFKYNVSDHIFVIHLAVAVTVSYFA
jgi:hypothetical protein